MGGQRYAPCALPSGKRPGTQLTGAGWTPELVWIDAEYLAPNWDSIPEECGP